MKELDITSIRREIRASSITSRSLGLYKDMLGFENTDLTGKKVLDIGSGFSTFGQEVHDLGCRVISLDAQAYIPKEDKEQVRALAQMLPFKDSTFDMVTDVYCGYWVSSGLQEMYAEMLRVLKVGGELRIHPLVMNDPQLKVHDESQNMQFILDRFSPMLPLVTLVVRKTEEHSHPQARNELAKSMEDLARRDKKGVLAPLMQDLDALAIKHSLGQSRSSE